MKIPLLVGMVVSTASLVTLGTFTVKSGFQNNSKISEQEQWRDQFYSKELYDKQFMCSSSNIGECSKEKNKDKEYLPSPIEDWLWRKAYAGYTQEYANNPKNIKDAEDWKDYCYKEVKNAIDEFNKEGGDKNYFNVNGHTQNKKYHDRCVLSGSELKK